MILVAKIIAYDRCRAVIRLGLLNLNIPNFQNTIQLIL
jgi:hypothetical protein